MKNLLSKKTTPRILSLLLVSKAVCLILGVKLWSMSEGIGTFLDIRNLQRKKVTEQP
jgi:hypothetical protein